MVGVPPVSVQPWCAKDGSVQRKLWTGCTAIQHVQMPCKLLHQQTKAKVGASYLVAVCIAKIIGLGFRYATGLLLPSEVKINVSAQDEYDSQLFMG